MIRFLYIIGLCALASPVSASQNIVLRTGFQLVADRYEVDGGTIRIYSGDGVTEMPLNLVIRVEPGEATAAPPADAPTPAQLAPEASPAAAAPPETSPTPAKAAPVVELAPVELADAAAHKYALPAAFVASVMRAESDFNPAAVSPKGAIGLMQLMPEMARELGVDAANPPENADAGTRYLRDLLARYENTPDQVVLALAAYNAGPAAVDKYHGVPPYRETREYILRVLKAWNPPPVPEGPAK